MNEFSGNERTCSPAEYSANYTALMNAYRPPAPQPSTPTGTTSVPPAVLANWTKICDEAIVAIHDEIRPALNENPKP